MSLLEKKVRPQLPEGTYEATLKSYNTAVRQSGEFLVLELEIEVSDTGLRIERDWISEKRIDYFVDSLRKQANIEFDTVQAAIDWMKEQKFFVIYEEKNPDYGKQFSYWGVRKDIPR